MRVLFTFCGTPLPAVHRAWISYIGHFHWVKLVFFLKNLTWLLKTCQYDVILYLLLHMNKRLYLMTLLHSLVDGLKLGKKCCQKVGVTFRGTYFRSSMLIHFRTKIIWETTLRRMFVIGLFVHSGHYVHVPLHVL